jgi:2-dehydro-3-deoxy-D-gluconate 5-dehydrogenase
MPTTSLLDLSGRVAVVTGGNGGIGRGIALGLAQAGAAVAVLARSEEKNQRVQNQLRVLGVRALGVRVDVTEHGQLCSLPWKRLRKCWGPSIFWSTTRV